MPNSPSVISGLCGLTGERIWLRVSPQDIVQEVLHKAPSSETSAFDAGWILPRPVDNHCHVVSAGLMLQQIDLSACESKEDVFSSLACGLDESEGWLRAHHYDQNRWGGDHITAVELDRISDRRPIIVTHSSGHAAAANTAALKAAGFAPDSPDPDGGSFGRTDSGALNGVLFENAVEKVKAAIPDLTMKELVDATMVSARAIWNQGYSAACDMSIARVKPADLLLAFKLASEATGLILRAYLPWKDVFGPRAGDPALLEPYHEYIAGIKIFSDGAIGSATAAIYGTFLGKPAASGGTPASAVTDRPASGMLIYRPDKLTEMVKTASDAGYQVAIHAIGGLAADLVMNAFEATGDAQRHRIEHAMILSDQQIERLAKLGCRVSMQPEFLSRFKSAYRAQLPAPIASRLLRMKSVLNAGISLSSSTDRPIVAGDPFQGAMASARRPDAYDQNENLAPDEALRLWLEPAADACGLTGKAGQLQGARLSQILAFDQDPRLLDGRPAWRPLDDINTPQ